MKTSRTCGTTGKSNKVKEIAPRWGAIFCENTFSRKISLRSSKSLINQAFLMAINPITSGAFAPSSSPATLLLFICRIVFRQSGKIAPRWGAIFLLRLFCSVQERYDLAACAGRVRREVRCVRSLGDAVCNCPLHGVVAIRTGGYVNKSVASADCRFTFGAIHERYHLTACAACVRREMRCIRAVGYAVCHRPLHRIGAV